MRENITTEVPDPEVPETDAEDCGDEVDCVDEEEARETEQIKAELKEREQLPDPSMPD